MHAVLLCGCGEAGGPMRKHAHGVGGVNVGVMTRCICSCAATWDIRMSPNHTGATCASGPYGHVPRSSHPCCCCIRMRLPHSQPFQAPFTTCGTPRPTPESRCGSHLLRGEWATVDTAMLAGTSSSRTGPGRSLVSTIWRQDGAGMRVMLEYAEPPTQQIPDCTCFRLCV